MFLGLNDMMYPYQAPLPTGNWGLIKTQPEAAGKGDITGHYRISEDYFPTAIIKNFDAVKK